MEDAIGIGTTLYIYENWHRSATIAQERASYKPYTITGETRGKWLLATDDGGWYEVNKKTLQVCGTSKYPMYAYTAQQMDERIWDGAGRAELVRTVQNASVDLLKQIAALVGYEHA